MEEIEIEINEDSDLKIETSGFSGGKCKDIIKTITNSVDGNIKEEKLKPEFYSTSKIKT